MDLQLSFPSVIDSTILVSWRSCKQKCMRAHMQRIAPKGTSIDLHAGGAFAAAVEAVRFGVFGWDPVGDAPIDPMPLGQALEQGFIAFMSYWGEYEAPHGHPKSRDNMWAAVVDYFREYPPATDCIEPFRHPNGKPGVEFTFGIPLPINHPDTGDPLLFGGRFDMLAWYNSMLFVVDEKTTKALGAQWTEQWKMRSQFLGYVWACNAMGLHVQGALIRGIGILKTMIKHAQQPVMYPDWLVEKWVSQMLHDVQEMIWYYEKGDPAAFPLDFGDACTSYGNCQFMELCTSQDPGPWIEADYEYRHWNPLSKDPSQDDKSVGELFDFTRKENA